MRLRLWSLVVLVGISMASEELRLNKDKPTARPAPVTPDNPFRSLRLPDPVVSKLAPFLLRSLQGRCIAAVPACARLQRSTLVNILTATQRSSSTGVEWGLVMTTTEGDHRLMMTRLITLSAVPRAAPSTA